MIIVVNGDDAGVEQVRKQLDKVIEVVKIVDITKDDPVHRELALLKIKAKASTRSEIIQIVDIFRANIVDVSSDSLMVEVTGDENKINSLLDLLRGFGIREIARTGRIALTLAVPVHCWWKRRRCRSNRRNRRPQEPKARQTGNNIGIARFRRRPEKLVRRYHGQNLL